MLLFTHSDHRANVRRHCRVFQKLLLRFLRRVVNFKNVFLFVIATHSCAVSPRSSGVRELKRSVKLLVRSVRLFCEQILLDGEKTYTILH